MSIIVQTGKSISGSILNNSTSKQMYSFSKAERFPKIKRNSSVGYYDIPSMFSKRFTTLGYGKRSDFTASFKGNNASYHDNSSDFNQNNPHGPKYTFSNGREKYGKVYCECVKMFDKDIPGPAKYNYLKPFGSDCPKYTMKGRNENPPTRKKEKQIDPAPNLYKNVIKINLNGRYPLSRIPNVNSIKMSFDKTKRSDYFINNYPGPAHYEKKQLMGRIFDSTHVSGEARSILGRYKIKDSRSNYPGPGSYIIPSDFGQYLSKDADKYPKENVYVLKKPVFEEKAWRHGMKIIKNKEEHTKQKKYTIQEEKKKEIENNN